MRTATLLLLLLLTSASASARQQELLNFGWRHAFGAIEGAAAVGFDDSRWQPVDLPHDASVYGPFTQEHQGTTRNGYRPMRQGWYRRHLAMPRKADGYRYLLYFEGVYRLATLYVNGQQACEPQPNGYMEFEVDVTDLLQEGDNVLAVSYDNTYDKSSRWYNGEGINRNVWLKTVADVHTDTYGVAVATPFVTPELARVEVTTRIKNAGPDSTLCHLTTDILDPSGRIVATRRATAPFASGETYEFRQQLDVVRPELWQVGKGVLYKVVTRTDNDTTETSFGIRTIDFDPDRGLLVNGERVYVNGVCLHTDLGPLGTASFPAAWDQRLSVITDSLGCNAIRLSHNLYPSYVLEWADRHGILVFDEFLDKWNESFYGKGAQFPQRMRDDMRLWIRRDQHHPSVFIWGVGNEVYEQIQKDKTHKHGVERLKQLVTLVRHEDPSRKVTVGQYPNRYGSKTKKRNKDFYQTEPHQFEFYTDVVSTNYLELFWDRDHQKYPQLVFLESEMAVGDLGYNFFNFDHSYPVGQFYWGGTDYIGEATSKEAKGWVRGLIDFTNRLKPLGQSVRSFYTQKPMTKIITRPGGGAGNIVWNDLKMTWIPLEEHWNYRPGDTLTVQVMSNCAQTELLLNGQSLGRKQLPPSNQAPELTWQVPYQAGELRAVGYDQQGRIVARDLLATAGKARRMECRLSKDKLRADGMDLAYIDITLRDQAGHVALDPVELSFTVSGAGTNAGVANADMRSDEPWQATTRTTYNGRAQLIVRAARRSGKLKVRIAAKGLPTQTITIPVSEL